MNYDVDTEEQADALDDKLRSEGERQYCITVQGVETYCCRWDH